MTRDAESFVLEVDYWRALLEPLGELEGLIADAAHPLASSGVSFVHLATLVRTDADRAALDAAMAALRETMLTLRAMQARTGAIGELIDGRLVVLARERDELVGGGA